MKIYDDPATIDDIIDRLLEYRTRLGNVKVGGVDAHGVSADLNLGEAVLTNGEKCVIIGTYNSEKTS